MSFVSIDPLINSHMEMPVHKIHGQNVSFRSHTANSYSSNSITWNVATPSQNTFMNRAIQYRIPMQCVFTSTDTLTSSILEENYDALRNLAGLRAIINQTITINGVSIPSQQSYMLADIVAHYKRSYRENHPLGTPDRTQYLPDAIGTLAPNPLSDFNDSMGLEGHGGRGQFKYTGITRGSSTTTLQFDLLEWLYIPELLGLDKENDQGLVFVRNFDVNMTLQLNGKYIWSHALGGTKTVADPTITITGSPILLTKFVSVQNEMIPTAPISFSHLRSEVFKTAYGAIAVNGTASITSNNIQLSNVPSFVFAYVKDQESSKAFYDSDTFAKITNMSINFNNQTALLSSASSEDLYKISKQCGLIDNFYDFDGLSQNVFTTIGTTGSIFCAAFGRHISLSDLSVGQSGSFNFSATVGVKNVNQNATYGPLTNATLHLVICYPQNLTLLPDGSVFLETPLSNPSLDGEMIPVGYDSEFGMGGSKFTDWIKGAWRSTVDWLKGNRVLSTIGEKFVRPIIETVSPNHVQLVDKITKGLYDVGLGKGGKGGAMMSKSELKKSISKL